MVGVSGSIPGQSAESKPMTDEKQDTENKAPLIGPQLVIEPVANDSSIPAYRWRVDEAGATLARGERIFADNYAAAEDAAKVALMILHTLSGAFCRMGRDVAQARTQASEGADE